jgi:hypothetical protein
VRLVFIDGDHSYGASRDDFGARSRFVVPGGLVAFHDIGAWEGVTRYCNELVRDDPSWRQVLSVNSFRVVQRLG